MARFLDETPARTARQDEQRHPEPDELDEYDPDYDDEEDWL